MADNTTNSDSSGPNGDDHTIVLGKQTTTESGPGGSSSCGNLVWFLRPLIITVWVLFVVVAIPFLIYKTSNDGFRRDDQLLLVGGLCVLAAIPLSVWHIMQHMRYYTKPVLQKHIVRILWMVPIYALNAWLGLKFYEKSFYMDCMREIYEAYVIYNFMIYLLNYLNLEMDLERTLETKPQQPHVFPLCFMQPWRMGRDLVHNCKHGILQYAVLRVFTTIIAIICELCEVYGEGELMRADVAYPYLVAVNNVSQFVAMYCLVLFYKANKQELSPMRPLPKFWCIKAVIFLTFFQSVIITILVDMGYVKNIFGVTEDSDANKTNLSSKLQDFLICVEMFIAAIAHKYSFPHRPFHINIPNYTVATNRTWFQSCWAMCDLSDVHADVSDHFGVMGSSMVRRLRGIGDHNVSDDGSRQQYDGRSTVAAGGGGGATVSGYVETDRLMVPNSVGPRRSVSERKTPTSSPSVHRRYGATAATQALASSSTRGAAVVAAHGTHIDIVKHPPMQAHKEYSPQFGGGAPRTGGQFLGGGGGNGSPAGGAGHSMMTASSMSMLTDESHATPSGRTHTKTTTSDSTSSSGRLGGGGGGGDTFTGLTTGAEPGMRGRSDSAASDWLSTPTDEMLGIDVSGPDKVDLIRFRPDDPSV